MFGKLMSLSDALMWRYYEYLTEHPAEEIVKMEQEVAKGKLHPKAAKVRLAKEILSYLHSPQAAAAAEADFERAFVKREVEHREAVVIRHSSPTIAAFHAVKEAGFAKTGNEAKAKIKGGSIHVDGELLQDPFRELTDSGKGIRIQGKIDKKRAEILLKIQAN
jgi:tyrosyl-tRNA synthetase